MTRISHSGVRVALCSFCLFWCVVGAEAYLSYTFGPGQVTKPMGQVSYHFGHGGLAGAIVWSSVMFGVLWAIFRTFSWSSHIKRLLLYNILVVALYFGLSIWEWCTKDTSIRILSSTWLVGFYFASFLALRKRVSNAGLKSLGAAFVATAAYFVLLFLSAPFVDPYF